MTAPTRLPLLCVLACLACTSRADPPPALGAEPIELGEAVAQVEEIVEPILATGTISAHRTTNLGPNVDGIVEAVYAEVGDRVRRGQPLLRTREVDCLIRIEERRAAVELAEAQLEKAQLDLRRVRELRDQQVVSADRLDTASTQFRIATAQLESARASLADAQQDLTDTLVLAPYDGVITGRYVDEGTYVRAMVSADAPVLQIMKTDVVFAVLHVPEIHLPRIHLGTPATIQIDGLDRAYPSRVEIINDRVETSSHAIELRLRIANADLTIKPGLFAKAQIEPPARRVLVLPRQAVRGGPDDRYVFVAEGDCAVRRAVETADLDAGRYEILAGLAPGERVLVGPRLAEVEEGSRVAVVTGSADAAG